MKKMLSVLLVLMLILSACVMPAAAEAVKATGSAYAMQGQVVVEVTIEDGKITAIDYVQYPETGNITIVAKERIPAQIIEHQTLDVDIATGATFASNAIMNAVKNAVKASGLEVAALTAEPYHAQPTADEIWDTDVLVMGGGGAGFAAAITAAQNGAKVIAFTDSPLSPISDYATHLLLAQSDMASFMDSFVAPMSIINAMIIHITHKREREITERFDKLEQVWDEYGVYTKR